ncbi:Hypothetical protein R9X50_00117800 [Acrodontium crateriforme]|uniref:Phytochrome n=1 Tax=Acrodontium crateriforme TaxID=150365 RepID=A0AAQ3LYZ5_9PEZI|nr:Hypothetical protein R9X50_00117800 [Acrodontium crateriforme]
MSSADDRDDSRAPSEHEDKPTTFSPPDQQSDEADTSSQSRPSKPRFSTTDVHPVVSFADQTQSPTDETLSPVAQDRVFPVRSVVSVDPTPTPGSRKSLDDYFPNASHARRSSTATGIPGLSRFNTPAKRGNTTSDMPTSPRAERDPRLGQLAFDQPPPAPHHQTAQRMFSHTEPDSASNSEGGDRQSIRESFEPPRSPSIFSVRSAQSHDYPGGLMTARFKHIVTEDGHAVITGRDGDTLQRCEDEAIHIPGAIQGFGLIIALEEEDEGKFVIRVVSENSKQFIGYTPQQLFRLDSFTDILSEEQTENLLEHVDFIREEDADVMTNGPEVFTISIRTPHRRNQKFWCAMHINDTNTNLIICEFEFEDDRINPLVPPHEETPEPPEDTLNSEPTEEEFNESTQTMSKPLRVLRSARKRKGEAAAMEVFNIMSQVQEQLAAALNLESFLKVLVGVVKELTGFHRVMIYQFDRSFNGRVVTELMDPQATKDIYKGLNFPASDIPKQARDLYKINKVRMLYDRDQETARLVCRTVQDLETPLDLTYSYLRAMSPIHLKYLGNMAVRSSMSISINAFDELWGLIACHSYGPKGMRVSFPIRKMCRLVGDSACRNIERLSYASRLQARKLINTVPTSSNPSGYIVASSEDLLKLFDADFGLLSIRGETKILGQIEDSSEALAMLEYLRMRNVSSVVTSQDIRDDFPDLRYEPGFKLIAGLLLVPLSVAGQDFIVFFRKGQMKEVKWAGNPYEKFIKEGTEGYLEPRKSFKTWSETVVGKCREWTEEEIETAAVLCLVYGKFIEVWRQKEAALQNSQLTRLLLANSAHEVRTPLNAIINYLEIALEGTLDQETRDNLSKSHSASKSLIYVINDLLDLTKTEEGGDLIKDEIFDLKATLIEATDMFKGDANRKKITYQVIDLPGLPCQVMGDARRVRQAISNVTANAIQNTSQGSVRVEMYTTSREGNHVEVEVSVTDTGAGISSKKLDALFRELEQVHSEEEDIISDSVAPDAEPLTEPRSKDDDKALGLGLAIVARIVRNMNGQLRLKSEEGKGSRFILSFPFDIPDLGPDQQQALEPAPSPAGSTTPMAEAASITPPTGDMLTLIHRSSPVRQHSNEGRQKLGSRKNSADSVNSRKSLTNSLKSTQSNISKSSLNSGKSEADRLIEAIQEPHQVQGWSEIQRSNSRGSGFTPKRPKLEKSHTTALMEPSRSPSGKSRAQSLDLTPTAPHLREQRVTIPGESSVLDQGMPIRAIRIPDDVVITPGGRRSPASITSQAAHSVRSFSSANEKQETSQTANHMRVLVAEDDPVNSRIIKKRLETLGHQVFLTVNGEECASTHGDEPASFDIVLMDMQMPIVDGITSTKMIRSFEKIHPQQLSPRASLNGRVPIIAVSASLVEKERQTYIDTGFDGWILKPISFARLSEIMAGIIDKGIRKKNLYEPGCWESGGWFDEARQDVFTANTKPDGKAQVHSEIPADVIQIDLQSDEAESLPDT